MEEAASKCFHVSCCGESFPPAERILAFPAGGTRTPPSGSGAGGSVSPTGRLQPHLSQRDLNVRVTWISFKFSFPLLCRLGDIWNRGQVYTYTVVRRTYLCAIMC